MMLHARAETEAGGPPTASPPPLLQGAAEGPAAHERAPVPPRDFWVMLGNDLRSPGGITAVVRAYQAGGLFDGGEVRYLATYHRPSATNKLRVAMQAYVHFLFWLLSGRVRGVHAHTAARGSFWRKAVFLITASLLGRATVLHLHDGSFTAWYAARPAWVRSVVRAVLRRVDRVVVLTAGWAQVVGAIEPRARIAVLHNPVVLPAEAARPTKGLVLFLARLWPEKGIDDLLAAAAKVRETGCDLSLVCAGDGDVDRVRRQAHALGLAGHLELPGWVDGTRKAALMQRAAVFVLPSYAEGLPMGVLEAMAWGVPVVASRVGGIPEALGAGMEDDRDGGRVRPVAGLLFEPGDTDALARHLRTLLQDADLRHRLGEAGRQRAARLFALGEVMGQLGAIHGALSSASSRSAGLPPRTRNG